MSRELSKMNMISAVQKLKKNDIECVQDYVEMIEYENQQLKSQLDYVKNGEYIKQLKFERDMLQDLIDEEKLSTEVYDIVKMSNKNTELADQLKQRDEVIDEAIEFILSNTYYNSSTKTNNGVIIDNDINELLEILQKGDNK